MSPDRDKEPADPPEEDAPGGTNQPPVEHAHRSFSAQSSRTDWDDDDDDGSEWSQDDPGAPAPVSRAASMKPPARIRRERSRRYRSLATLLVVLLVLALGFWLAYSYFRDPDAGGGQTPPVPTCRPATAQDVSPESTKVNVFNATNRAGLAKTTSTQVANLGFQVGTVANDPLKKEIPGPAEVRYGPKGKANAQLVLAAVGKGAASVEDTRKDATVDLVLGDTFRKLGPLPSPSGLPICSTPSASGAASASP